MPSVVLPAAHLSQRLPFAALPQRLADLAVADLCSMHMAQRQVGLEEECSTTTASCNFWLCLMSARVGKENSFLSK